MKKKKREKNSGKDEGEDTGKHQAKEEKNSDEGQKENEPRLYMPKGEQWRERFSRFSNNSGGSSLDNFLISVFFLDIVTTTLVSRWSKYIIFITNSGEALSEFFFLFLPLMLAL